MLEIVFVLLGSMLQKSVEMPVVPAIGTKVYLHVDGMQYEFRVSGVRWVDKEPKKMFVMLQVPPNFNPLAFKHGGWESGVFAWE